MILPFRRKIALTADLLNETCPVGDEDEGSAVFDDFLHALHALELKLRVANREHFVDDQDFRLEECSNRECQPEIHPARIAFNGRVKTS